MLDFNYASTILLSLAVIESRPISQQLDSAEAKVQAFVLWVLFEYMHSDLMSIFTLIGCTGH
jgi:hypothetical protein